MIFVTVGNPTQSFRRLLEAVDAMAGGGIFDEEAVLIQSGNNPDFKPQYCEHKSFLSMEEFIDSIKKASLVICHAGAGTLIHVLQAGKIPLVMPRQKRYGEHVDDHQIQLVEALVDEGRIIAAFETEDLPLAIAEARKRAVTVISQQKPPMLDIVKKAIHKLI